MQHKVKQKIIKNLNYLRVINLLRNSNNLEVSQIAENTNLSKPTVMKILNNLMGHDLVMHIGKGNSTNGGGKKPNVFKFNENGRYSIGMSITKYQLCSVITNLNSEVIKKLVIRFKINEEIDFVIKSISDCYKYFLNHNIIDKSKIIGIAIGFYGLVDYKNGIMIYSPHYPSWGKNIKIIEKIQEKIGIDIPITIDNLSRFYVIAEKTLGFGKNYSNIISIIAGYGLVAGIIINNSVIRGYHKITGEVGHMTVNPSEEMICACGSRGCFEVMVSIERLKKLLELKKYKYPNSILLNKNHDKELDNISTEEIFEAFNQNDKLAEEAMEDIIYWFAVGLSNIIKLYDPEMVILYGIYVKVGKKFLAKLLKILPNFSIPGLKLHTKIKFSKIQENAGVLGAATSIINDFFN